MADKPKILPYAVPPRPPSRTQIIFRVFIILFWAAMIPLLIVLALGFIGKLIGK
jgi:hypothetical protein